MVDAKRTFLLSIAIGMAAAIYTVQGQGVTNGGADPTAASRPSPTTTSDVKLSAAERILRLEQTIEETRKELTEFKKELDNPEGEYVKAKDEFTRLDKRLKEREREQATQPEGERTDLSGLRKARELAKERFDLAIKEHNAIQQKCTLLERKLQQEIEALEGMRSPKAASQPAGPVQADASAGPSPAAEPSGQAGPPPAVAPVPPQATVKVPPMPSVTAPAQAPGPEAARPEPTQPGQTSPAPVSEELLKAQKEAQAKAVEAQKAEEQLQSVTERIATLRENLKAEQDLLETARQRSRLAQQAYSNLRDYVQKLISTGAPVEDITRAWTRIDDAEKRVAEAESEVTALVERIDELQSELNDLLTEHNASLMETEQKRTQAKAAEQQVQRLQNPYSLLRLLQWTIDHGPPIVGILIGMAVLIWITKVTEQRIVRLIAMRGETGTQTERESRARTLASVFKNVATTAVVVGGSLMILTEVGINIVPLLGAAGVVGLAVAFGAQSLIKDYFSGFIILLENQYAINDVVKIGSISGMVEHISLRMTQLRDTEGNAHFVPHGEIKSVTNMTHGWSRAVFDVGVAYKERVDDVMKVLIELGRELRRDPAFAPLILDDPEMLGVESLGDSAVVVRFLIKTRPLRQWMIKREMLRRIKNRFDELGIEIPFPHRTIYHRHESDQPSKSDVLAPLPGRSNTDRNG